MPHSKECFDWFDNGNFSEKFSGALLGKTKMLYVGFREDSSLWWVDEFSKKFGLTELSLVEIWPKNCQDAREIFKERNIDCKVIQRDVLKLTDEELSAFDVIFWDQGPQQVSADDLTSFMKRLSSMNNVVILVAPWGEWRQGALYTNENESHVHHLDVDYLNTLGVETVFFGKKGKEGNGELVAVRVNSIGSAAESPYPAMFESEPRRPAKVRRDDKSK